MLSYSKTAMDRAMKVQGVVSQAKAKKITGCRQQKNGGATGCGKDAGSKSKKTTFPPSLEIPQTPRDSHFPTASATAGD
jgi:hypothetical protein